MGTYVRITYQDEIKCRLEAGDSCHNSIQTILSSRLLSNCKNLKIKIYKTMLSFVLYGYEAWSLRLREERRKVI